MKILLIKSAKLIKLMKLTKRTFGFVSRGYKDIFCQIIFLVFPLWVNGKTQDTNYLCHQRAAELSILIITRIALN